MIFKMKMYLFSFPRVEKFKSWFRSLLALTLIPLNRIDEAWEMVLNNKPEVQNVCRQILHLLLLLNLASLRV